MINEFWTKWQLWPKNVITQILQSLYDFISTLEGKIYALGGHNGLSIFESVEFYDSRKGIWEECRAMLSKRCRLGVAALNGKIYAVGGYDGSSFLRWDIRVTLKIKEEIFH